jgi:hypothetical protein
VFLLGEEAVVYLVLPLFTSLCFKLPIEMAPKRPTIESGRSEEARSISLAVKMDVLSMLQCRLRV